MLGIILDRTAAHPLGRQLAEALRNRIRSGELPGGTQLPATRPLAESLSVSRTVAVEAYEQLQAEGYLEGRKGSGCYVCEGAGIEERPRPEMRRPPRTPRLPKGCISFDTGLPALDLIPWDAWAKALKEAAPRLARWGYGEPEGLPELREALAAYLYRARGLRVTPEDVQVTSGSTQALSVLTGLCCSPQRGALIEDPCHRAMRDLLQVAGVPVLPHPVDHAGLKVDQLPAGGAGLLYVTPSHQFPLGGVLSAPRRAQLVAWARSHRVLVLEDDYDGEFRYGGPPLQPLRESDPEAVAFTGTFSKTFSPALRLGYVILPLSLRARWAERKRFSDVHSPLLEQAALARFLASGRMEHHIHRMRKVYASRREALLEALAAHFQDGLEICGAAAGIHLAVRFPGISFTAALLDALREAGVNVLPVRAHALQRPSAYRETVLLGYGNLDEKVIRMGIQRLHRALRGLQLPGRTAVNLEGRPG